MFTFSPFVGYAVAGIGDEGTGIWGPTVLSGLVVLGYAVIACNWYFHSRLHRRNDEVFAIGSMRAIFVVSVIFGFLTFTNDVIRPPFSEIVLFCIAFHTWTCVVRMRGGVRAANERFREADALELSVDKYREIAELLPHMVWTATSDGRVDFSNRRWVEYVGDGRSWMDAAHPDEQAKASQWWAYTVAGRRAASLEVRLGGRCGYRTYVVTATPIFNGEAIKWLGACADIEDQKLLASDKERQAKQKLFFLNALSHDLRAPLNNVALKSQVLKAIASDAEIVEAADTIMENAMAAGELVTRLLDFAKLGTQDENDYVPFSMSTLVAHIVRRYSPVAEKKSLYLKVAGDPDFMIVTDRVKLERIIGNLVDNGMKYTQSGGVELSVKRTEGGASIVVSDTGMRIPAKSVPHLFDEFYQVNNHERDSSKGFGLGLAICGSLARQLGGDVRLASTGREGSSFEVSIAAVSFDSRGRGDGPKGDLHTPQKVGV